MIGRRRSCSRTVVTAKVAALLDDTPHVAQGTVPGLLHCPSRPQGSFRRLHTKRALNVDVRCSWERVTSQLKPPLFACCHQSSTCIATVCMSKQVPFFACRTCRKLTEGRGFRLEINAKSGLRGMPLGSYESIKDALEKCQTRLQRF